MSNPAGTNSPVAFDRFTRTIPYGEKRVQGDLLRSAPLPGGVSSPLNIPRQDQRRATRTALRTQPASAATPLPQGAPAPPSAADVWTQIASTPGAERYPILGELAAAARQA